MKQDHHEYRRPAVGGSGARKEGSTARGCGVLLGFALILGVFFMLGVCAFIGGLITFFSWVSSFWSFLG